MLTRADLSDGAVRLYGILDSHWRDKDECWPSQETLARELCVKSADTVQRRIKELEKAQLVRVKRQGLRGPNLYLRLKPRRHLHAVSDETPETAEVRSPDTATLRCLEAAEMRREVNAVEADAKEEDKSERSASRDADKPAPALRVSPALRALVYELNDSHDGTYRVFARAFLPYLHDGYFEYVLDRLDEWRACGIDDHPVESEAAKSRASWRAAREVCALCGLN